MQGELVVVIKEGDDLVPVETCVFDLEEDAGILADAGVDVEVGAGEGEHVASIVDRVRVDTLREDEELGREHPAEGDVRQRLRRLRRRNRELLQQGVDRGLQGIGHQLAAGDLALQFAEPLGGLGALHGHVAVVA